ncbi:uncharacterized protein SAPINGB_P001488 [Magnusiomyces paraingens]|uniref:Golgi SNAP receptor complex member 1 n=1 Tax=Magnusiomyces paraingens TaxID=2606893 RepID=A0A5E8BC40_9ASCO|nr:uncharacterized protein SAPINGB_P001488 [Saprochaete ingens]VVT46988.1 unnamed protein product [Saprochaete ingens]
MATFSQLRAQLRSLETDSQHLLSDFSSFAQSISSSATEEELRLSKDIEENLAKREETIATLARTVNSEDTPSITKDHQLQRHKETLAENRADYIRLINSIKQERVRTNLLSSVRTDIELHRARESNGSGREAGMSDSDYMISERNRIDNSHSMADSILAQAYETREEFARQRQSLSNVQRRLQNTLGQVPGINTLISKVNTRKKRDSLILAGIITLCILFLLFVR